MYDLYRGPGSDIPDINGVLPRSEFGVEIHIAVAFLTFIIGILLDEVCGLIKLFWKIEVSGRRVVESNRSVVGTGVRIGAIIKSCA